MHKAIHICNSHQPTLQPKIAKEYIFAKADRQPKKNTARTTLSRIYKSPPKIFQRKPLSQPGF